MSWLPLVIGRTGCLSRLTSIFYGPPGCMLFTGSARTFASSSPTVSLISGSHLMQDFRPVFSNGSFWCSMRCVHKHSHYDDRGKGEEVEAGSSSLDAQSAEDRLSDWDPGRDLPPCWEDEDGNETRGRDEDSASLMSIANVSGVPTTYQSSPLDGLHSYSHT